MPRATSATTIPTEQDALLAREASRALEDLATAGEVLDIQVETSGVMVRVPAAAARVLKQALIEFGAGNAVTLVPVETEITTQQAADILNVSRPHLVGLIEKGTLPARMVGSHRRVRLQDALDYKAESATKARAALADMAAISQEQGLE